MGFVDMAKIAFLILAHEENSLRFLLRTIVQDGVDIFLHIDGKSTIRPDTFPEFERLNFIKDRRNVYWGGFNMVMATIDLMRAARGTSSASHFFLLSGDSILISSVEEIISKCHDFNGSFVDAKSVPILPELRGVLEYRAKEFYSNKSLAEKSWRFENYTFLDSNLSNPRVSLSKEFSISKRAEKGLKSEFRRVTSQIFSSMPPRNHMFEMHYTGSQWWGLNASSLDHILELSERKDFLNYFRYMKIPDEQIFQTVVGNLNCKQRKGSPMYVNWERRRREGISALIMEDLITARKNGFFFARKQKIGFDPEIDELLLTNKLTTFLKQKADGK